MGHEALQDPLLTMIKELSATLTPNHAALAEDAAAIGARLINAAIASGQRQPAAQDEEMRIWQPQRVPSPEDEGIAMQHNDPKRDERFMATEQTSPEQWAEANHPEAALNPFLPFEAAVADAKVVADAKWEADRKRRRVQ